MIEWVKTAASLGAGEILLTSIDQEGTGRGFDISLVKNVKEKVNIPVIASGGMGKNEDLIQLIKSCKVDAVAIANVLHKNILTVKEIKNNLSLKNFKIRK